MSKRLAAGSGAAEPTLNGTAASASGIRGGSPRLYGSTDTETRNGAAHPVGGSSHAAVAAAAAGAADDVTMDVAAASPEAHWPSGGGSRQDEAIEELQSAFYNFLDEHSSGRPLLGKGLSESAESHTPLLPSRAARKPGGHIMRESSFARARRAVRLPADTHAPVDDLPMPTQRMESLDYDMFESRVTMDALRRNTEVDNSRQMAVRWLLTFLIGVLTALIAVLITYASRTLNEWKFRVASDLLAKERSGHYWNGSALGVYVLISVGFAAVASFIIARFALVGAGSGISEIKTILNGVKIPGSVRVRTLIAKVTSVMFSVAAGLPVGKEGPMIHSGAITGAGVSQGKSTTMGFDTKFSKFQYFRTDQEKRDFVVCGSAAGVAAAFGAPVGGVLFALEEGASFWFQELTWRSFFCALVSTYVLNTMLSGIDSGWGTLSEPGLFTFGDYGSGEDTIYQFWEIPVFVVMGAVGGALGAVYNGFNTRITAARMRFFARPRRAVWVLRVCETMVVAFTVAVLSYTMSAALGRCKPMPDVHSDVRYRKYLVQFYCADGEYNDAASYFFTPSEDAIKQLFHFTANDAFSLPALAFFSVLYSFLTMWTYGTAVASGLFIPSLLAGSAFGRFVGEALNMLISGYNINAGTYALVGAAASLGGMARMTISLAVILLESTGNYQYGLPLMLTLLTARFVGNLFNEGIYDIHIEMKHWPLLEWDPDPRAHYLLVSHVMTPQPRCLHMTATAGTIYDLLRDTQHNGFPIVSSVAARTAGWDGVGQSPLRAARAGGGVGDGDSFAQSDAADESKSDSDSGTPHAGGADGFADDAGVGPDGVAVTTPPRGSGSNTASPLELRTVAREGADNDRRPGDDANSGEVNGGGGGAGKAAAAHSNGHTDAAASPYSGATATPGRRPRADSGGSSSTATASHADELLFSGMILRKHLAVIIEAVQNGHPVPALRYLDFEQRYPRYPKVEHLHLSAEERRTVVDLRPFVNRTPYVTFERAPLLRAFRLFRGLGLRHLPVVDHRMHVVGMVTRADLTHEAIHHGFAKLFEPATYHGEDSFRDPTARTARSADPSVFVRSLDGDAGKRT